MCRHDSEERPLTCRGATAVVGKSDTTPIGARLWTTAAVLLGALCLGGAAASPSEAPAAVSPGGTTSKTISDSCPTFSWGQLEGASSYELVVYRIDEREQELTRLVFTQQISGSALGWTPSLDRCLERGEPYAWSVRAVLDKGVSDWAAPMLFEVAAPPSAEEVAEALEVLRRHLASSAGKAAAWPAGSKQPAASLPQPVGGDAGARSGVTTVTQPFAVASDPQVQVEGEVRTVDAAGQPRLWGRGRPNGSIWFPNLVTPCTNGSTKFGLTSTVVDWGSAADACPAGAWVCRQSDLVACDTLRPDTSCDSLACTGFCANRDVDDHWGWIADHLAFGEGEGIGATKVFTEKGATVQSLPCELMPVWCCWQ